MIAIDLQRCYVESLDGRDTNGWTITLQLGPLVTEWAITWGRRR